jgi:hypothetical protein
LGNKVLGQQGAPAALFSQGKVVNEFTYVILEERMALLVLKMPSRHFSY